MLFFGRLFRRCAPLLNQAFRYAGQRRFGLIRHIFGVMRLLKQLYVTVQMMRGFAGIAFVQVLLRNL